MAVWVYIVQRHGSADILAMGACKSEEEAIESVGIAQCRMKISKRWHHIVTTRPCVVKRREHRSQDRGVLLRTCDPAQHVPAT